MNNVIIVMCALFYLPTRDVFFNKNPKHLPGQDGIVLV